MSMFRRFCRSSAACSIPQAHLVVHAGDSILHALLVPEVDEAEATVAVVVLVDHHLSQGAVVAVEC